MGLIPVYLFWAWFSEGIKLESEGTQASTIVDCFMQTQNILQSYEQSLSNLRELFNTVAKKALNGTLEINDTSLIESKKEVEPSVNSENIFIKKN